MAAESTVLVSGIDQRLDALDRALLGLLPRAERLAMVADVEARVREEHVANPAAIPHLASLVEESLVAEPTGRHPRNARRRRSTLAFTSGVIGIVALTLLFFMPVTYLVVVATSEMIGEIASYVLLSGNIVVVALGGAAAVVMGIAALVRLNRRQGQVGHGWAITGLCTGPLPALVGGLATITFALPMLAEVASSGQSSGPTYVSAESCAVCPAPSYASPAVNMPPSLVAVAPVSGYAPAAPANSPSPSYYGAPATGSPVPAASGAYEPGAAPTQPLAPAAPASLPSLPDPVAPPPALPATAAPSNEPTPAPTEPLNTLPPSAAPQGE